MSGSEPAADAELVFAVRVAEALGQVSLLAVNDLATHAREDHWQNDQWPEAVDEQTAAEIGDRVGKVDGVAAEPKRPGGDHRGDLIPGDEGRVRSRQRDH